MDMMDESWILIDGASGLHVTWYFWLRVLDEANRSARYGSPFALLLLEAEPRRGNTEKALDEAVGHVAGAIRSTDLAGRLGTGRVGVLLPEQDAAAAERAMERIVRRLDECSAGEIRWDIRLLCYPGDGAEISNLLTTGWTERRSTISRAQSRQPA